MAAVGPWFGPAAIRPQTQNGGGRSMNTTENRAQALEELGRMAHGEDFVAPFAKDLGLNVRSLQRMLASDRAIPEGVLRDALQIIDARRALIVHMAGLENHPQDRE